MCHPFDEEIGDADDDDLDLYAIPEVGLEEEEDPEMYSNISSSKPSELSCGSQSQPRFVSPKRQPSTENIMHQERKEPEDGSKYFASHTSDISSRSQHYIPPQQQQQQINEKNRAMKNLSILTMPSIDNPYSKQQQRHQSNQGCTVYNGNSRPTTGSYNATTAPLTLSKDYSSLGNKESDYAYDYMANKKTSDMFNTNDLAMIGAGDGITNDKFGDPYQLSAFTFPKTSETSTKAYDKYQRLPSRDSKRIVDESIDDIFGDTDLVGSGYNSFTSSKLKGRGENLSLLHENEIPTMDYDGKRLATPSYSKLYGKSNPNQNSTKGDSLLQNDTKFLGFEDSYSFKSEDDAANPNRISSSDSSTRLPEFTFKTPLPAKKIGTNGITASSGTERKVSTNGPSLTSHGSVAASAAKTNPFYEYQQMLASKAGSSNNLRSCGGVGVGSSSCSSNVTGGCNNTKSSIRAQDTRNDMSTTNNKLQDFLSSGSGAGDVENRIDMVHRRVNAKGRMNLFSSSTNIEGISSASHGYASNKTIMQGGNRGSLKPTSSFVDHDLILVNGRSNATTSYDLPGKRNAQYAQKQTKNDFFRFGAGGGKKEVEEDAEGSRRPLNERSHYGKLHKYPTRNGLNSSGSPWDDDPWTQFPKPTSGMPERGRSAIRSGSTGAMKAQVSQSAYFPSTTLYSKTTFPDNSKRKASSEPSVNYYQRQRSPTKNSRFSSGRHSQVPRRQNWTEPVYDAYPQVHATMNASDLFDLQNNIQRARFPPT
ncbi:hypothetical protein Ocin01_01455 [Orchesella cincta]|uniref:Uncharacterized protein n=1 Tax=Orchesella cincta TaxID=48709 RepID=A0A1D2NJ13_ORCCI|nr:hypothetical protein Ocin01_01455 [Orchesella cincta]